MADFQHPADIPIPRALAVWTVMCSQATIDTWDLIDEWVDDVGLDATLSDIRRILEANGSTRVDDEVAWWRREITKPGPN